MEGCELERAFRVQYTVNSGFSEILELEPVRELHLAWGCVCGPANWDAANLWYFSLFWKFVRICMIVDSLSKSCHRSLYLSLECLDWFAYPRAKRKSENCEHKKKRVLSKKLVKREKTEPHPPTVINLWFHVNFDWLLHDGKCQNQNVLFPTWIWYNIDITAENRFGKISYFQIAWKWDS